MDPLLIISIIGGVALVFLLFGARLALRWMVRVILLGVLLLTALGGAVWWWLDQRPPQSENKPRQINRGANSNRR